MLHSIVESTIVCEILMTSYGGLFSFNQTGADQVEEAAGESRAEVAEG